jgi:hypothetical protein
MINLSLNFKSEIEFPSNIHTFEEEVNKYEFTKWFKVIHDKIVPLSSYNWEKLTRWDYVYSFSNLWEVYNKLSNKMVKESFYVVLENWKYNFYIDNSINEWHTKVNEYVINKKNILKNILNWIFWEKVNDVYLDKIISDYLEIKLDVKDRIVNILKIKSKWEDFVVKFDEYIEVNWWNPNDEDYYNYWWGFVTRKVKIKKWDLL